MRVVPLAFAAGSLLHLLEFTLLRSAADGVRAVVITLVYLHLVGFGAILLSGFWSIANEYFDPREAKLRFGRIAGAGTVGWRRRRPHGGAHGGAVRRGRRAAAADVPSFRRPRWRFGGFRGTARPQVQREAGPVWQAARDAFRQAPFLVNLAVLVLLGTMSAALLDYLFKSGAAAEFGKGPALTRYFAVFYTANQVLTFAVQAFLTPVALRRLGLGRTVGWHPAAVAFGSAASLLGPAGYDGAPGSRTGTGAARIVPSLRLRTVFHARASAGKARGQDLHRRGLRPHGGCVRRRHSLSAAVAWVRGRR